MEPRYDTLIMTSKNERLRSLDFLRGVAILLVLCRHQPVFEYLTNIGWIGVDLFFVLSGFFVSGLLFREYRQFGNIRPGLFLIRRGFKIYPMYYIFSVLYIVPKLMNDDPNLKKMLADLFFLQNYISGWGYFFEPSWSLAVEEHFYFALALVLGLVFNKHLLKIISKSKIKGIGWVEIILFSIMVICLTLRIRSNYYFQWQATKNFTATHLRLDSLLAGVLVSYLYYFKNTYLRQFYQLHRKKLCVMAIAALLWTPFIPPVGNFFVMTIGFTLLYISFGILLLLFLMAPDVNMRLEAIFSKRIVDIVCKAGLCSYAIYIIHAFVNLMLSHLIAGFGLYNNPVLNFIIANSLSILIGIGMTYTVERYFLSLRDKHYPVRQLPPTSVVL